MELEGPEGVGARGIRGGSTKPGQYECIVSVHADRIIRVARLSRRVNLERDIESPERERLLTLAANDTPRSIES